VEGELWFAYSVAIQSAERAELDMRTSSMPPLKYSPLTVVSPPRTTFWLVVVMLPVFEAWLSKLPLRYILSVEPSYVPTTWVHGPIGMEDTDVTPPRVPAPPVAIPKLRRLLPAVRQMPYTMYGSLLPETSLAMIRSH